MSEPLIIRVRNALCAVAFPETGRNIVAEGAVEGLDVADDGLVRFALNCGELDRQAAERILQEARAAAEAVDGVSSVSAVATAHGRARPAPSGHDNPFGLKTKPRIEKAAEALAGVRDVIAVVSGKGGVGKSTITANLAVALAASGLKVGLMDADVYGPSLPTLFGVSDKPSMNDGKIEPLSVHGVRAMSIGLLVDAEQALAWRGPMVMGAVRQLMNDVNWGDLDVLLIDTPPGTGDAHLSLIQSKRLTGAIIVSTPQEMALADVRRGANLLRKTDARILGVIENMAWLETDAGRQFIFGQGGAEKAAADLDAPFLGTIPLYPELRIASDNGTPIALEKGPAAEEFRRLAELVRKSID